MPSPEYSLVHAGVNIAPYADFLVANGSLISETGPTGSTVSIAEFKEAPMYMQRVVQPSTPSKELLLRAVYDSGQKQCAIVSYYTKAIVLKFDQAGNCSDVMVNEYA